jgi:hypothetical protein
MRKMKKRTKRKKKQKHIQLSELLVEVRQNFEGMRTTANHLSFRYLERECLEDDEKGIERWSKIHEIQKSSEMVVLH